MAATVTYSLETIESQFQANHWNIDNQLLPDVQGLSDGGYVVAYNNGDLSNGYIAMDFYDAAGNAVAVALPFDVDGDEIETSTDAFGAPSLTELDNGNVVVVWADASDTGPGIRAAIFTSTGEPLVPEFALADTGSEELPQVTALEGGGFVVCYQGGPVVLAKIFDDAGNATGPAYVILQTTAFASEPAITALADGGFVAVWTSGDTADDTVIRARVFNADGTPRTVNGSTNDFIIGDGGDNSQPAVAALPNGGWAVAYTDTGWADQEGDVGITLTILGPDGNVVADAVQVNSSPSGSPPESDPAITVLANGFIVVSWTYGYSPASGYDLYFRVFDQDGDPVTIGGSSGPRVLDVSGFTTGSAVSALFAGQFVSAWQDDQSDGSGGRISASVQELVRTTTGDNTSETLSGDELRDIINGQGGNDTLNGGDADDTLNGGADNDTLNGGAGLDTASYAGATGGVTVALSVTTAQNTGGAGNDTLSSIENLIGSGTGDTLSGTAGVNTLTGSGGDDALTGYAGNDTLNGDNGNDTLNGGATNDTLNGGENNDTLIGQDGNDTLNGGNGIDTASYVGAVAGVTVGLWVAAAQNTVGDGTDTLSSIENLIGSNFADTLSGTSSINTISGGGNNDDVKGYSGDDTLNGDNGNDLLNGGANNDTLNGGADNDTLIGQDGNDTLAGGNGIDTASYVGAVAGVTVGLWVAGAQNTGGDGTDTLTGIENLIGSGTGDTLSGSSGNNTLTGNGGDDFLTGYSGLDTLNGDNGDDTLNGGASNDTLNGGGNNDTLIGQDSNDTLTGGSGADDFFFDDGHGADTVTDFQNGSDQFDLSAVAGVDAIGDLTIIDNGATVTVNYGTGSFTIGNLGDPAQLDAGDFVFA